VCFAGDLTGDVRPGLAIRLDFYYEESGEKFGSHRFVARGNEERVWMVLQPPSGGWATGRYRCKMYVDGAHRRDLQWIVD
jgi:hypothetical protein